MLRAKTIITGFRAQPHSKSPRGSVGEGGGHQLALECLQWRGQSARSDAGTRQTASAAAAARWRADMRPSVNIKKKQKKNLVPVFAHVFFFFFFGLLPSWLIAAVGGLFELFGSRGSLRREMGKKQRRGKSRG